MRCRISESVLNEILGLNNKPKAVVHLEEEERRGGGWGGGRGGGGELLRKIC